MGVPFDKPLEEWLPSDLQAFVSQKTPEQTTIEYKVAGFDGSDDATREVLRDISAMANASGGYLLIGISEDEEGCAKDLIGIPDGELQRDRILSSCLASIEPRMGGLKARTIGLTNGKTVLVIYIPRSHRAPHMVTFKGLNQFWVRHDRQKSKMAVEEIADAFRKADSILENLDRFLLQRQKDISELGLAPIYVLSAIPVMSGREIVDIFDPSVQHLLKTPPKIPEGGWHKYMYADYQQLTPTLYGIKAGIRESAELEVFRTGYVEARIVIDDKFEDRGHNTVGQKQEKVLYCYPLIEYLVSFCHFMKAFKASLGLEEPFVLNLWLFGIKEWGLRPYQPRAIQYASRLEKSPKNDLALPPLQVPSFDKPDAIAKQFSDRLWQAFGYEHAPLFEGETFRPPR